MVSKLICLLCVSVVLFQARWSSPSCTLGGPGHALYVEHHLLVLGFLQQRGPEVFLMIKYHRKMRSLWYLEITENLNVAKKYILRNIFRRFKVPAQEPATSSGYGWMQAFVADINKLCNKHINKLCDKDIDKLCNKDVNKLCDNCVMKMLTLYVLAPLAVFWSI